MNFNDYLLERMGSEFRDLIVVDVQPLYEKSIESKFPINEFVNFLKSIKKEILYFYNGPETIASEDSPERIVEWLNEKSDYALDDFDWDKIEWIDKGYGFYRGWIDFNVSDHGIQQALRYMANQKKYDSREVSVEKWKEVLPEKDFKIIEPYLDNEMLITPEINVTDLKENWNGSLLCGGGMNECLKEIQLLLNTFNIKYKLVDRFIF